MLEVPLRRGGGGTVCHTVWPCLRWRAARHCRTGYSGVLTLNNATGSALDADQVTEADVVGGDVVTL
jgi:hypothetical protein